MQNKKLFERGGIMIEMIAVLALMGAMGTVLFRQMQHRNEELDSINMASEIRVVKEATMAYIQANRTKLENGDVCASVDPRDHELTPGEMEELETFMPDHWSSGYSGSDNLHDGLLWSYRVALTCYTVDPDIAPRKVIYGTIIPNEDAFSNTTTTISLKLVARVANLIGADGGVHIDGESGFHGTMGSWEMDTAPFSPLPTGNYFVATTGMDVYVPDAEISARNAVATPNKLAVNQLHSTGYFSVGNGNANCVSNYAGGRFNHEDINNDSLDDTIEHVGTGPCDPLFWVGTKGGDTDKSTGGQVYVKNSLYIGRDNTGNKQAISLETNNRDDSKRQITVHDTNGAGRLFLNANGQVIGRASDDGKGYRLDPTTGELTFYETTEIDGLGRVEVPIMRMKDGVMETNEDDPYGNGKYRVDPAFTSVMNDIRLASRGGAKLSEVLPNYISKEILSHTFNSNTKWNVTRPTCPDGYVRAVVVTPTSWSQYVTRAELKINIKGDTNEVVGSGAHMHNIDLNAAIDRNTDANTADPTRPIDAVSTGADDSGLTLRQKPPVRVQIDTNAGNPGSWDITADYSGTAATGNDPISMIAQTYCVFDSANFDGDAGTGEIADIGQEAGTGSGSGTPPGDRGDDKGASCSIDADCLITEQCTSNHCKAYGSCDKTDGTSVDGTDMYCIGGKKAKIECSDTKACTGDKICRNYRCISGS